MVQYNAKHEEESILVAIFNIGEALFGLNANRVQEVVILKKFTKVHHAPAYIRGVMNLRGRVVSIIDLGEKLEQGLIEKSSDNRIFIVEWKQEYIGLLVERISEVYQLDRKIIKNAPGNVNGVQSDLIDGVFLNIEQQLVGLLNLDKVLELEIDKIGDEIGKKIETI
jgi:purine-binding chemotaxis protein CheW